MRLVANALIELRVSGENRDSSASVNRPADAIMQSCPSALDRKNARVQRDGFLGIFSSHVLEYRETWRLASNEKEISHGRVSLTELVLQWGLPAREIFRSWLHRLVRSLTLCK
jgi:hypothetical protein